MIEEQQEEQVGGKTMADLGREALWFGLHTLFAVLSLGLVIAGIWLTHPSPDATQPKLICSVLAFVVPGIVGMIVARMTKNEIAQYVWISGILMFSIVCVYVLDLPTGPGLCEKCTLIERLYRTFFFVNGNSGLMGGDGILIGSWIPLSMISYAIGARLGVAKAD